MLKQQVRGTIRTPPTMWLQISVLSAMLWRPQFFPKGWNFFRVHKPWTQGLILKLGKSFIFVIPSALLFTEQIFIDCLICADWCTVVWGGLRYSQWTRPLWWVYSHLWRNFSYVWRKANPARRTLTFSSSPRYSTWCRQRSSSNICGDFLSLGLMQRT